MARILLRKDISNLKVQGFENVERKLNINRIEIDGIFERIRLIYSISYILEGRDVTNLFEKRSSYDWYIGNDEEILVRDENFQPVPNPDYVSEEETPDIKPFLYAPAFTLVMDGFDALGAIPYSILEAYIDENDGDGKWDIEV